LETLPEYSLDDVADFLPKESDALADAFPSEMDGLTAGDFSVGDSVQGEDVEERLSSLFGSENESSEKTDLPAEPQYTQENIQPQEMGTNDSLYQPPSDDEGIMGEPTSVEERVEGNDIAKALDTLFSGEDLGGQSTVDGRETTFFPPPEMGAPTDFVERVTHALEQEPIATGTESAFLPRKESESDLGEADSFNEATSDLETVTGDDIGNKIDALFGPDDSFSVEASVSEKNAELHEDSSDQSASPELEDSMVSGADVENHLDSFFGESTQSALKDAPDLEGSISGSDVENQFDSLFGKEAEPSSSDASLEKTPEVVEGLSHLGTNEAAVEADIGDDFDAMTLAMPAMTLEDMAPTADSEKSLSILEVEAEVEEEEKEKEKEELKEGATDIEPTQGDVDSDSTTLEDGLDEESDQSAFASADATMILPVASLGKPYKSSSEDVLDTVEMAPESEASDFDLPGLDLESELQNSLAPSPFQESNADSTLPLDLGDFDPPEISELTLGDVDLPDEESTLSGDDYSVEFGGGASAELSDSPQGTGSGLAENETSGSHSESETPPNDVSELLLGFEADTQTVSAMDATEVVSGVDIQDRLSEIFGEEPGDEEAHRKAASASSMLLKTPESDSEASLSAETPEADIPLGDFLYSEGAADTQGLSRSQVFNMEEMELADLPDLPPLEDADVPVLGENETLDESTPNVATVTLAEIYFQQGLKEQALQIYRQLLDRDPENEKVRQRVEEIGVAITEGESQEGDSNRNPRPGMKVPRRKL
jgi:hypothetical protein